MTTKHTHVHAFFANPFMICSECKQPVKGFITPCENPEGCEDDFKMLPCRHKAGCEDTCPSWSPVNGCQCIEHLGYRDHSMNGRMLG